jgi:transglutaminase-like putative cysteine protease
MSSDAAQTWTVPLPAAIERYLELALYLLVLTGFGTLASTGGLDLPTVLLVGAALLFRGYLIVKRRTLLIPERWMTALTLAYVVFYLSDYFLISGSFLNSTVHLVLFVMVVRLFSAYRDRDRYFLAVIAFLMVLAAAVLTVDSVFLLAFAAFMLTAVVTVILMEMAHASHKATVSSRESRDQLAYRHMAFSLAGASPVLVLFILLGAGVIFFALPRVAGGYFSGYSPSREFSTGFSNQVELGRIGEIQQSNSVVMHIQIDNDQRGAFDLKWRGITLNDFDGRTWTDSHEKFIVPHLLDGSFALWQPSDSAETSPRARRIHYHVLMEPVGSSVFFLAPDASRLQGDYRMVGMDRGDAVFNMDAEHPVSSYEATSVLTDFAPSDLRQAESSYPPEILRNYLQLPPLDARIPRLAETVTARAHNNYDKAVAIELYLRNNYGYTLQLPRVMPHDPLANFLFNRKRGHCEYFASSMAVMLRSLRIPSRVVNGFRTGEFNDLTSQYVVRGSNAHSWVEAYFPGYGWIDFDPTPAGPVAFHTGWGRFALYLDAMASFWREWVVNYDASHQRVVGQDLASRSHTMLIKLRAWGRRHYRALLSSARRTQNTVSASPLPWSLGGASVTILLILAANLRRLLRMLNRRRLSAHPERSPRAASTIWYERMTHLVARHGWRKSPGQTPSEFVRTIEDPVVRRSVEEFTRRYEHARFGDSAEDAGELPEIYEEISAATRRCL